MTGRPCNGGRSRSGFVAVGAYFATSFGGSARAEQDHCKRNGRRSDQRNTCRRRRGRLLARLVALVSLALAAAGCGRSATTSAVLPGINRSLPRSTYRTQQAVLRVWVDGERQLYAYMDRPPGPARLKLRQGIPQAVLWPKLRNEFTGAALSSERQFLANIKNAMLNGPTTYNLGTPSVRDLSGTSATVAFCRMDSGTTTSTGKAGPLVLDGGPGGARGTVELQLTAGAWKIYNLQSVGVNNC